MFCVAFYVRKDLGVQVRGRRLSGTSGRRADMLCDWEGLDHVGSLI